MNKLFTLTRDNVIGELVNADEKSLDHSQKFNRGTLLTIVRPAHLWGNSKGIEYCTVEIGGSYFNIPARLLAFSIAPKHS